MKKLKSLKEMSDDLVQGSEKIDSIGTTCWHLRLDQLSIFCIKISITEEDVESKHSTKMKYEE